LFWYPITADDSRSLPCASIFLNSFLLLCRWKLLPWRHADNREQLIFSLNWNLAQRLPFL
jgi:hypothetical protein